MTHVLISHNHGDHLAGATVVSDGRRAARFPNARYVINRAEWAARGADDPLGVAALHLGALEAHGKLDLVDGDLEVTPGVTFLHAPGESLGHSVVRVASDGQTFYDLADLFHFECEVEHQDWAPWGVDIPTAMETDGGSSGTRWHTTPSASSRTGSRRASVGSSARSIAALALEQYSTSAPTVTDSDLYQPTVGRPSGETRRCRVPRGRPTSQNNCFPRATSEGSPPDASDDSPMASVPSPTARPQTSA